MAVARGGPPRRQRGTESWTTIWKKPWGQARTRHSVRSFISSAQLLAYLEKQIGNTQSEQKTKMIKCVALNQDSLSLRARAKKMCIRLVIIAKELWGKDPKHFQTVTFIFICNVLNKSAVIRNNCRVLTFYSNRTPVDGKTLPCQKYLHNLFL